MIGSHQFVYRDSESDKDSVCACVCVCVCGKDVILNNLGNEL